MVVKIYDWNTKKLIVICNDVEIIIYIDEHIRIDDFVFNYHINFSHEISNKLHRIDILDIYAENEIIKQFNYQLKERR